MRRSLIDSTQPGSKAITIVELVIYGGLLFLIGYSIYQGVLFFQEWQCRKNMSAINEAIELHLTSSSTIKSLSDIKGSMKTSGKAIPKCPAIPIKYNYFFNIEERRVRCPYHGVL